MRCPKCGYISFDNQDACRKCSSAYGDIVETLAGTAILAEPADFLSSFLEAPEFAPDQESAADQLPPTADEEQEEVTAGDEALEFDFEEEAAAPEPAEDISLEIPEEPEEHGDELAIEVETAPEIEPDFDLDLEDSGDMEAQPAAAADTDTADEEIAAIDLSLEDLPPAPPSEAGDESMPELSLDEEAETTAGLPELSLDEEAEAPETLPELDLNEEAAEPDIPVGEPAPLRDTTDIAAGLEEINLSDLVTDEEESGIDFDLSTEEPDLELGAEEDNDALDEALFDLSDILDEETKEES